VGEEEGNQWLAKPSFSFHNVSQVQDSIKEFAAGIGILIVLP
jgi:hypothetical protein